MEVNEGLSGVFAYSALEEGLASGVAVGIEMEAYFQWSAVGEPTTEEPPFEEILEEAAFAYSGGGLLEAALISPKSINIEAAFTYSAIPGLEKSAIVTTPKDISEVAAFLYDANAFGLTTKSIIDSTVYGDINVEAAFLYAGVSEAISALIAGTTTPFDLNVEAKFIYDAVMGIELPEAITAGQEIGGFANFIWDIGGFLGTIPYAPVEINEIAKFLWGATFGLETSEGTGEEFITWVLTGYKYSGSTYEDFDFNSYATYAGKQYAAKDDGIYLLEGDDDNGETIHPQLQIAANFGTAQEKRIRSVKVVGKIGNDISLQVTASQKGDSDRCYPDETFANQFYPSRLVQDRELTLDFLDFEELSHMDILPLVLVSR